MQKLIIGLLVFLIFLSVVSCGTYPCGKASAAIALVSFTDLESDTIILRRFTKSTNFTSLRDTILIRRAGSNFVRRLDTVLIFHPNTTGYDDIVSDYDYEVFIPKANRLFRLTQIVEDIQYGRKNGQKVYCINPISSCRIDGVEQRPGYDFIYLKK